MPHCLLEYTKNIPDQPDFNKLFSELHNTLVETGEFNIADFKSRAIRQNQFLCGDDESDRIFVHLEIRILEGRSDELKSKLAAVALNVIEKYFHRTLNKPESSITVQITDLNRAGYKKRTGSSTIE